jgi:hypothetical protein
VKPEPEVGRHNPTRTLAFFAYPSKPVPISAAMRRAARDLQGRTELVPVTWQDLARRGSSPLVVFDLLEAIDSAAVSVFEVTYLNQNVLFELGYAIGREERVWLLRDPSLSGAERAWQEFEVLTGVRYTEYQSAWQVVEAFESEQPWNKPETIYSRLLEQVAPAGVGSLVYLKSRYETDAERELSRKVDQQRKESIPIVVADPAEASAQPLSWYAEKVYGSAAVLVHLTAISRIGAEVHNARCALVAGLAHGMGRPLLMLAEADFLAPLDYRELLKVYRDPNEAVDAAESWMIANLAGVEAAARRSASTRTRLRLATELSDLRLGEAVAEMEENSLEDYFVPTAAYGDVLAPRTTVFVGRKGTGKTANLLRAAQELERDKRNLVCIIKPAGYELEGLVRLLTEYYERDTKGYLVESLWKFLLESEIALAVYRRIQDRSVPPAPESPEWAFARFLEAHPALMDDFAVRLEHTVSSILAAPKHQTIGETRAAISEQLHATVLQGLRGELGRVLSRTNRVAVLIDNLDKAWDRSADIDQLSFLLLGLLAAVGPIAADFGREDRWRQPVRLAVSVFLRSDIFSRVVEVAREPDRIPTTRLLWDDRDLLLRVVEDRYRAARRGEVEGSEIWGKFFVPIVDGVATRDYIASRVLPRPRDLLVFCNAAITTAVNRGHSIIEPDDIHVAERSYSLFALEALKVEMTVATERIEEILYEYVGAPSILEEDEAMEPIARIVSEGDGAIRVLDQLRLLGFLGVEVTPGRFSYAEEGSERARDDAMVRRFKDKYRRQPRLEIHPAFRAYLEIIEVSDVAEE